MSSSESQLRRLLANDDAAVIEALTRLRGVHEASGDALEATYGAYSDLFQALDSAGLHKRRDREIAMLVCQICARHYKWAAADLLRGRSTAVLGYGRTQAECVGLVHLFLKEPTAAEVWLAASNESAGKAFYRKYQGQLLMHMRSHPGLEEAYNRGSGESLHVRVWPILRAYAFEPASEAALRQFTLQSTDIRHEDPFPFLESAGWFFGLQAAVVNALRKGFPEIAGREFPSIASAAYFAKLYLEALDAQFPDR